MMKTIALHRYPEIDSLRALAVLSVVAYHVDHRYLPGGFAGVDIFFVISGYVVTRSLIAHKTEAFGLFVTGFYARRIVRIMPALLVCLTVTVAADVLFIPRAWLSSQNFSTAQFAVFGLSNIFLSSNQEAYFSPRSEFNPYLHTWSLGVEEQFYVVLPPLFFVVARGSKWRQSPWLASLIPLVCVISITCSALLTVLDRALAYYSIASRFWELGVGALLAIHHFQSGTPMFSRVGPDRSRVVMAIALLAAGLWFSNQRLFPFPCALLVIAGSALFIDRLIDDRRPRYRWMTWSIATFIGTISYSIYLWHWPVLALVRWTVGLSGPLVQLTALAAIALLAVASYRIIEVPFQSQAPRMFGRTAILGIGIASVVMCSFAMNFLHDRTESLTLSNTRDSQQWYALNWSSNRFAPGCHSVQSSRPFSEGTVTSIVRIGCQQTSFKTVFVAGDSHAGAYSPVFGKAVTEKPIEVRLFSKVGCPVFALDKPLDDTRPGCASFVGDTIREITHSAKAGDVLFLPSLRLERMADQWSDVESVALAVAPGESDVAVHARRGAVDEAVRGLAPLEQLGMDIVFEAPKPIFAAPAFRCSDWFNRPNSVCAAGLFATAQFLKDYREPVLRSLREVERRLVHVRTWDPFPILCPDVRCLAVDHGTPLFFDGDHLSGAGALRLYPDFMTSVVGLPPNS